MGVQTGTRTWASTGVPPGISQLVLLRQDLRRIERFAVGQISYVIQYSLERNLGQIRFSVLQHYVAKICTVKVEIASSFGTYNIYYDSSKVLHSAQFCSVKNISSCGLPNCTMRCADCLFVLPLDESVPIDTFLVWCVQVADRMI